MRLVNTISFAAIALALSCTQPKPDTAAPTTQETAETKDKPAHPDDRIEHRWNLADLYASDDAWRKAYDELEARFDGIAECKGKLGTSAARLADCLDLVSNIRKELSRLLGYSGKRSDEDTRNADALAMRQRGGTLATTFGQKVSFIDPEILKIGEKKIKRFIAKEPRLKVYEHGLEDTLRRKPHTLDEQGEKLLAGTGLMAGTASSMYGILSNSDIPWPTVTLSDGTEARLDNAGYTKYRAAAARADRKLVFDTFWAKWKEYEQTMGVALDAQMKKDVFYMEARGYKSCLENALDGDNVPDTVYRTLVKVTNDNLATLHRYLKLRARMLGIDDLAYYDLYPPIVSSDLTFPIEQGKQLVLESMAPLGKEYTDTVKHGFENRWMDAFPRQGKRSGAYSSGSAYDVHPYVLLNYNDDYSSVSTLAHEWGHTMHSFLANKSQPYPTSGYAIFVAEVASTFNEALLLDHVLETAKSDDERIFYLGSALDDMRQTFFRQTMFAEFELQIHELAEKREALTGERLTKLYAELVRRYHGHDQGIVTVHDEHTLEWAYIPHFYYNYYVYKYATSLAASSLFAKDVLAGVDGARDRYLALLQAGGSDYPYELLKNAGVDLATPAPYEALVARFNSLMDQIEAILDKQGKTKAAG